MYFPKFTWLVRDFNLELVTGGKTITADEYLEQALQPLDGDPDEVGGKNAIRTAVLGAFRDRTCFTLVRPVNDEEKLQNLQLGTACGTWGAADGGCGWLIARLSSVGGRVHGQRR